MLKQNLFRVVIFVGLLICVGTIISCDNQEELSNPVKVKTEKNTDEIAADLINTLKLAKEVYVENKEYEDFAEQMQVKLPKDNFFANIGIQTRSGEAPQVKNVLPETLVLLIKENWLDKDFDKLHTVIDEYYQSDEFKNFSNKKKEEIKFSIEVFEKVRYPLVEMVVEKKSIPTKGPHNMMWNEYSKCLCGWSQEERVRFTDRAMAVLSFAPNPIGFCASVYGLVRSFMN